MPYTIKTNMPLMSNQNQIAKRVADFWDQISPAWQKVWGDHIHHGYYFNSENISPRAAQEMLIQKLAEYLTLSESTKLLDVGCGMGGSTIYLAKNFGVQASGITLSSEQIALATANLELENFLSNKPVFQLGNALSMADIDDESFDIVWSLESCEQFFDKGAFLREAWRILKPGSALMLATWCSSKDEYIDHDAKQYVKLCKAFDLPYTPTMNYYIELLKNTGFQIHTTEDWSNRVEKSWEIGISLASAYDFFQILKMGGWRGLRFTKQLKLMKNGFRDKKVFYGVFIATKDK